MSWPSLSSGDLSEGRSPWPGLSSSLAAPTRSKGWKLHLWLCKLIVLSFPFFLTPTAPGHLAQCVSQNFRCAHSQHSIFFTFTVGNRLAPFLLPHLVWMAKYNLLEAAGLEGSPLGARPNYPRSSTLMAPVAARPPRRTQILLSAYLPTSLLSVNLLPSPAHILRLCSPSQSDILGSEHPIVPQPTHWKQSAWLY